MKRTCLYWWRVISEAVTAASETVGWGHPKRWPISALAAAFFCALLVRWLPGEARTEMAVGACMLAAVVAVFLMVTAYHILQVPPKLAEASEQDRLAREASAVKQFAAFKEETAKRERKLLEQITALDSVKEKELKKRLVATAISDLRTPANGYLEQLSHRIDNWTKNSGLRDPDFLKDEVHEWYESAATVIEKHFPWEISEFREPMSGDGLIVSNRRENLVGSPQRLAKRKAFVESRIQKIRDILARNENPN